MANSLVTVKSEHICDSVKFLTLHTQQPNGVFVEIGRIIHGEMIGDVLGADTDASMTAFCLIALQESRSLCSATVDEFEKARPVVRWFNKQQNVGGGYGSTQATMIVYQAVAEYWASPKEPEYDLNVDIMFPGMSRPERYNFNRENHYTTRTTKMVSLYYALPKEKESDCTIFNLTVELTEGNVVHSLSFCSFVVISPACFCHVPYLMRNK
ncbi:Complement C3 [Liparis tanakae]|uniref:Complement C3 n=1 Tax=Liparis tanakae TaxID=230148 RepID=A0A4Z2ENG0_9TELE|nr:Complement C3 [Liparis tanakae]